MGLDITAYSRLDYIGHRTAEGEHTHEVGCCYSEDYTVLHIQAYAYDSFPHALVGIPGNPNIKLESGDTEDPFMELIYFADNEGTILWKAARELLKDFEEGREKWRDYCLETFKDTDPRSPTYMIEKYEDWAHAFKLASDGGLVDFH